MHPGRPGKPTDNILVTGHRGYIGSVLLGELFAFGYRNITGLDSNLYRIPYAGTNGNIITEIQKDIRDIDINDVRGFDTVIHLAGLSNDPLGDIDEKITYEINYEATKLLARLSKEAGVRRFIFSSTCSVYGGAGTGIITEETPVAPLTAYARSKLLAEKAISRLADNRFCPVILRNATVYGLSPGMRFDLVVNNLVASAYITGEVILESDGTSWRPLVHVKDVCKAIVLATHVSSERIFNNVFNVGSDQQNYQIINIAKYIKKSRIADHIRYTGNSSKDARNYNVSFEKIRKYLTGFDDCITMAEGINEVYSYLNENRFAVDQVLGPRCIRIKHIKKMLEEKQLSECLRWA